MSDSEASDRRSSAVDTELLVELQRALAPAQEVPARLMEAAREALAWRDPDAALAELIGSVAPAGVRGNVEQHVFIGSGGRRIEIELRRAGRHVVAAGHVSPAGPAAAAFESQDGLSEPVDIGPGGVFEIGPVPRGPVRFMVNPEDSGPIYTDWITV